MIRLGILSFIVCFLTSCGSWSKQNVIANREKAYLSAQSIPPLRIPPGISSNAFESTYPVSSQAYPLSAQKVDITPPGLNN